MDNEITIAAQNRAAIQRKILELQTQLEYLELMLKDADPKLIILMYRVVYGNHLETNSGTYADFFIDCQLTESEN